MRGISKVYSSKNIAEKHLAIHIKRSFVQFIRDDNYLKQFMLSFNKENYSSCLIIWNDYVNNTLGDNSYLTKINECSIDEYY